LLVAGCRFKAKTVTRKPKPETINPQSAIRNPKSAMGIIHGN
jgi:hypothetical protein